MMSGMIRQETAVFLLSVLHGALLVLLYDLLRSLRRAFVHGKLLLSAEDFLFWILAAFLTFLLVFSETDGVFRGYVAAGIFLGSLLYHMTLSALAVKILSKLFRLAGSILSLPCRFLSFFTRKIWRICKKRIEIPRKKRYNRIQRNNSEKKSAGRSRRDRRNGRKKETAQKK